MTSGIYKILNKINNDFYIGSTYKFNKKFSSVADAARFLGNLKFAGNLFSCAKGKQKTAYGYTWKFIKV
jgi:hypothetical protein